MAGIDGCSLVSVPLPEEDNWQALHSLLAHDIAGCIQTMSCYLQPVCPANLHKGRCSSTPQHLGDINVDLRADCICVVNMRWSESVADSICMSVQVTQQMHIYLHSIHSFGGADCCYSS